MLNDSAILGRFNRDRAQKSIFRSRLPAGLPCGAVRRHATKAIGAGKTGAERVKQRNLLPILVLAGGLVALAWVLIPYVRPEKLVEHYGAIVEFAHMRFVSALLVYMGVYILIVVLSLPVALLMTLLGGALFGGIGGGAAAMLAATLGACLIFLAARGLMHDYFVRKTEAWLGRLRREFQTDTAFYLLMLRLTPVFPFAAINLAAGLLGARFFTFAWTTLVGIAPAAMAYAFIGAGLNDILRGESARYAACRQAGGSECTVNFDPAAFISRDVVIGLVGLAVMVLVSQIARKWLARSGRGRNESRDGAATE